MSSFLSPDELSGDPNQIFTVVGKLGEGSYGTVHKAIHIRTSTLCALKLIPADDVDDIDKEIGIMRGCESDFVVQFYGSWVWEGYLWIAMEYCGAGSVADVMRIGGATLREPQIASVCAGVLHGLRYLHSRGKIHRDIKAGNILLTTSGAAKLADFGVAGQLSENNAKRTTVIGTPFWMAPEVIQEVGYNTLADIWSLGITAIEMADGHPPYHKIHPMRAIFMIPTKPAPKLETPSKWSDTFNDFIARCLTKNPAQRPAADELLQHPFIANAPGASVLTETILDVLDKIAAGALDSDEEQEDDDTDEHDTPDLGTMRLDTSTMKPIVRAANIPLATSGTIKARASEAAHTSADKNDDEDAPTGTMQFSTMQIGTFRPQSAVDSGDVDDPAAGTMRVDGASGSHQPYQPAFMQYLRAQQQQSAQPAPANLQQQAPQAVDISARTLLARLDRTIEMEVAAVHAKYDSQRTALLERIRVEEEGR
ncbi:serine/threonine kinase 4 [Geranomyces variabilis]|nr:serine/threonine kinase 4 [Geranomyces variabilis]KAJ3140221.1 Serine/threonine-protein kinase 4 [Geranomyces variabilis]